DPVADQAEHEAADRPRPEPEREHRESQELLGGMAGLGKELPADVAGEVPIDGEIEPFEHVPDETGECSSERRLARGRDANGHRVRILARIANPALGHNWRQINEMNRCIFFWVFTR